MKHMDHTNVPEKTAAERQEEIWNLSDPCWHGVCAGRAVVCVDDDDRDDDGGDHKHHGEKHVFPYERNSA